MQKEQMKKLLFSFLPEIHEKNLIHEFPAGEDSMAIGISLENIDEERNVFVYNIFCGDEYINIITATWNNLQERRKNGKNFINR